MTATQQPGKPRRLPALRNIGAGITLIVTSVLLCLGMAGQAAQAATTTTTGGSSYFFTLGFVSPQYGGTVCTFSQETLPNGNPGNQITLSNGTQPMPYQCTFGLPQLQESQGYSDETFILTTYYVQGNLTTELWQVRLTDASVIWAQENMYPLDNVEATIEFHIRQSLCNAYIAPCNPSMKGLTS
jgi:hypothetical protein